MNRSVKDGGFLDCLALLNSGNYAMNLCRIMENKGYVFEVVSTPCKIAKGGCGYSIKFPYEYKDLLIIVGNKNNIKINEIYKIVPLFNRVSYEKIY